MLLSVVRFRMLLVAGFLEKYQVSPNSILGHCFDECLEGQRWQCVKVQCAEMSAGLYAPRRIEMTHE